MAELKILATVIAICSANAVNLGKSNLSEMPAIKLRDTSDLEITNIFHVEDGQMVKFINSINEYVDQDSNPRLSDTLQCLTADNNAEADAPVKLAS